MNIYFSGLGGVGIGPLAEIAAEAGETVMGSDLAESLVTHELRQKGIPVNIGQDGTYLQACHDATPLDAFVHTSALPDDHPELLLAKQLGITTMKRDAFLSLFIEQRGLQLIAIAGTHGKTTTTGMMVWALQQLGIATSYSVGTTLSFGPSGHFDPTSKLFVYECDEYDRNFLAFSPALAVITSIDYDHPDSFPSPQDYTEAFRDFLAASTATILWQDDAQTLTYTKDEAWLLDSPVTIDVAGEHNRRNATLVVKALERLGLASPDETIAALQRFPGTDRRFQKLADNLYSDYGHHPKEIAATLQMASEISQNVALVYQPHQNRRQHEIINDYTDQFERAKKIYWLPTYLSREDPHQAILTPNQLSQHLTNVADVIVADLDDRLWHAIQEHRQNGDLVLMMGAGTIDDWVRQRLAEAA